MFGDNELSNLIDMAGLLQMECGWQVVIRAEWTDATSQKPHGLDYAIILQNERGTRLLGFDNSHAYDGAAEDAPWDHEHKPNRVGQRFPYNFVSASKLITAFFDRLEAYCKSKGVSSDFSMEQEL